MPRPLPALNLRADFYSVAEGEHPRPKDVLHRPVLPGLLSCGRRDVPVRQVFCDGVGHLPLPEDPVDEPHRFRFFRHNLHLPILPFPVTEEGAVGQAGLAVRKPLPFPPCAVFRNAPALLLRQRGHDGNEQLALGVQRVDVFLLGIGLHAFLLQLPDRGEAVHRVPCEPAHRLGHDEIRSGFPGAACGETPWSRSAEQPVLSLNNRTPSIMPLFRLPLSGVS